VAHTFGFALGEKFPEVESFAQLKGKISDHLRLISEIGVDEKLAKKLTDQNLSPEERKLTEALLARIRFRRVIFLEISCILTL
jgi:hypothetical protein